MTRSRRIEELFASACDLPTRERAAFVASAAGDDAELRVEVMSLIDHAIGAAETLGSAVSNEATAFVHCRARRHVGRRIGQYRIVGLLGEGGMGAVYAAERADAEFEQRVAIKILPFGLDLPDAIARFRDERQILASLEHPNIVRLLDGGRTDDDLPYLVMEEIDGRPITAYAAEHDLSVDARVRLFRDVCEAVHYAHGKLVVHRDLKPSNIFVDATGTAKLLDFGIAKLIDPLATRGARTRTGTTPLTPQYASPEQAAGRSVTFATDIYSLGAVLRELLPADAGVELETIVMKAMIDEPEQRYGSAEELADDLGRYLAGLPVRAHRPTLRYRARKYLARHRIPAVAIAAILTTGSVAVWALMRSGAASDALPPHDRKLAVIAVNRGAADDDWLAPAVARIAAHRLRDHDLRFVVVDNAATANVTARIELRRTPTGVSLVATIGPRRLEPIEADTIPDALDKLIPITADVVGRGQPERGPDEHERAEMARLGARSFAAYRAYEQLANDVLRTPTIDEDPYPQRAAEVVAIDPSWAHPYALQVWASPNEAAPGILKRARENADRVRDPDGGALIDAVELLLTQSELDKKHSAEIVAVTAPVVERNPDDLIAAWSLHNGYGQARHRAEDQIALLRRLHERYPGLRFGGELAAEYRIAGRLDDADRMLREWLRTAPEAEQAFVQALPTAIDASNADAAVRLARDLVFLHGAARRNLLVLCDTLIAAGRFQEAAVVADRLLTGSGSDRATARNRIGVIAISEGRFASALDTLASPDETDVGNLELARGLAQNLGSTSERDRIQARIAALTPESPPNPVMERAARFQAELEHGCPDIAAVLADVPLDAPIRDFGQRWMARMSAQKGCVPCSEVVRLGLSTSELDASSLLQFVDCAERENQEQLAKDALDRILAFRDPYLSIVAHYRLGRVLEHLGKPADARKEYATFLAHWGHADRALPEVDDARAALARLGE